MCWGCDQAGMCQPGLHGAVCGTSGVEKDVIKRGEQPAWAQAAYTGILGWPAADGLRSMAGSMQESQNARAGRSKVVFVRGGKEVQQESTVPSRCP